MTETSCPVCLEQSSNAIFAPSIPLFFPSFLSFSLPPLLSPPSLHPPHFSHPPPSKVMLISQYLLLQTTPPAALVRLRQDKCNLRHQSKRLYQLYRFQHHTSIHDFLCYQMEHDTSRGGLLLQVSWVQPYSLIYSAQYEESRMSGFSVFRHFLSHGTCY